MPLRSPRRPRRAPERGKLKRAWERARGPLAAFGLASALAVALWPPAIAWWLDFSDEPVPSDYLVVLGGDYARPHAAAELYKAGLAPEVWFCRPWKTWGQAEAQRLGVDFPSEEDLYRRILLARGVPESALRVYGDGVPSTKAEAEAFRSLARPAGRKVLVLTSRYHARRARLVFRRAIPDAEVRVVGAPDPAFTRRWWTNRSMAAAALLESAKLAFWLVGGRF